MDTSLNTERHTSNNRDGKVRPGNTVLLRTPNGDVRCLKAEPDSPLLSLGKLGSFHASELIDQPYGLTFEIIDKNLAIVPPPALEDVEDTDATNELINDGEYVQLLTLEEIEALKMSGAHGSDIIRKQIEQHTNYSLKTEYSKEKYKKKKTAKYSKTFTVLEPSIFNVCEYWYKKDQSRVRDLRIDTLSQMLNMANVKPAGRYIAVDDASGLLVSGILDRLGGKACSP